MIITRRHSKFVVVVELLIMSMNGKVENQLHWGSLATKYPTLHESVLPSTPSSFGPYFYYFISILYAFSTY